MTEGDLACRVAALEAREQIRELVMVYCHLLDARDLGGVAGLFSRDGAFVTPGTSAKGQATIEAFYAERMGKFDFTFHYPHTHVITLQSGGQAAGTVTQHAEHGIDGVCVLAGLRYDDEYVWEDDAWRFARREISMKYYLPWGSMGTDYWAGNVVGRPPR
jgi:hypothetical protein